jgi:glycine/D-amino acid oxidase-like deaminating enzyme
MIEKKTVIVVGGGIIGASIAWHLTAAGARVTLVTQAIGGVATPTSFAWINASWGNPEPYFRLRSHSMEQWRRLAGDVSGIQLGWNGGLCWDLPRDELRAYVANHDAWGYDIREVSESEAARIEPALRQPPEFALHARSEGAVEPITATLALIEDAKSRGLHVLDGLSITGLEVTGSNLSGVRTTDGVVQADHVVVAAGSQTPRLAATLGVDVPIDAPPGLIVHSRPVERLLNGLVIAPELHLRQTHDGRIIAGSDFGGTDPGEDPDSTARELFGKVKAFLKGGDALEMAFHTVGYRPTPKDGFPILGAVDGIDGLYLAVTHSGITLAPAIGQAAASEILTGKDEPLLAPYRLARFG